MSEETSPAPSKRATRGVLQTVNLVLGTARHLVALKPLLSAGALALVLVGATLLGPGCPAVAPECFSILSLDDQPFHGRISAPNVEFTVNGDTGRHRFVCPRRDARLEVVVESMDPDVECSTKPLLLDWTGTLVEVDVAARCVERTR